MTQDTYGREILHCSQGTASQKLSGQLALSALDIFHSATAFNVSTDYLYGLTDTRTRKSTAVSPTVAIHHGDHGTYEPARTTIEQNSQQQTFKQTVI